jgi:hypothetical protein
MKISVKDCLSLESLTPSILAAGRRNIENRVRSVSVMDAQDPETAEKENGIKEQLVLTSFSGLSDDEHAREEIVKRLAKAGVSAIVVFRQSNGLTSIGESVVKAAEEYGLPLIVLPRENTSLYENIIEDIMDELRYGDNFKNGLINNTIYHLLDFEKHRNFQSALKEAALSNNFQVVLLSRDFNPILAIETRQKATIADAIRLGKERDVDKKSGIYTFIDVNGVLTYWGPITVSGEKYFLFIVDNEDSYSTGEISKLAEIIELAIGMWKYTPERDVKAEFIKALTRDNKSLAYSLKDELGLDPEDIIGVFYARGIENPEGNQIVSEYERRENIEVIRVSDSEETNAVIVKNKDSDEKDKFVQKMACIHLFDKLKEGNKTVRIFHATGINGIEGAGDAFRLIGETWTFVESVFPYKRVFTKYELSLVSNCINLQVQGGYLKKTYMDLLEPFKREMGENKARQLLDTLETFVLDAGMNSSKTSTFMGIHTNTVQYRLKRINEVLGAEITGNRVIPGLTMALALKRLERVVK